VGAVSQSLPLGSVTEAFAQGGPIEKKDLKVGFIPITCATPIINNAHTQMMGPRKGFRHLRA
jgi:nitrate/nitrite transport system substrate-binding protein